MSQPAPGWPAIPIPQIPYGYIVASTVPDGAEVYLDGQPIFDSVGRIVTTPVTLLGVSIGIRKVTFRKEGYFDENISIYVENGLYSDAYAILKLRATSTVSNLQPKQQGIVHFDTSPHGADILVDGQIVTNPDTEESIKTPASILLYEGRRDFTLQLENHYPVSGYVDIFAGTRVDIFKNLTPIPGSNIRTIYPYSISNYQFYPYELKTQYGLGDIFIDSTPRGAYIYIDNISQANNQGNALLTPSRVTGIYQGLHEVQISLEGYYSKKLIINVIPDKLNIAYAKLEPITGQITTGDINMDTMQPKQYGIVYFDSQPHGAQIYVDGQLLIDPDSEESLKTPARALLIEGRRDFTFVLEGYEDASGYVDVLAGTTVNIYRNLKSGKSDEGWGKPQQQWFIGDDQPFTGDVVITTYPEGATIIMDDYKVVDADTKEPLTTPVDLVMYMGIHNLVFSLPGYFDEFATVYVNPGSTQYIHNNFNIY